MSRTIITPRHKWDGKIDPYAGYEYAIAYMISELLVMPISEWDRYVQEKLDECMEARIFGQYGELHLFREDDEMKAVIVRDLPDISNEESDRHADDIPDVGADMASDMKESQNNAAVRTFATIDRLHDIRRNCLVSEMGINNSKARKLIIREYIDYDGDGQAYTALTRVAGLL